MLILIGILTLTLIPILTLFRSSYISTCRVYQLDRYQRYGLHRRVNVFIYLNDDWQDSYGGHLELWSQDMNTCGASIRPNMGRFVVFSSTDFSYHGLNSSHHVLLSLVYFLDFLFSLIRFFSILLGHPHTLTCPEDRSRRSIALYYYTKSRPSEECVNGNCFRKHSTLFQPLKKQCNATEN